MADRADGFDTFWLGYPRFRRSAKGKCAAIWKHLGPDAHAEILAALPKFAALWNLAAPERFHFCPMPSTYLNQRRDGDDLTAVARMVAGDEPGGYAALMRKVGDSHAESENARAKALFEPNPKGEPDAQPLHNSPADDDDA